MNKAIATVLLAAVFAALTVQPDAVAQERAIYKWVDAEGVVHYSAHPPEGVDYKEVGIETREPIESADAADELENEQDAEAESAPPEQPATAANEPDPELVAERCAQARNNIEQLNRYENVTIEGEDGEQRPISDEERMGMLEQARQFIDEWC